MRRLVILRGRRREELSLRRVSRGAPAVELYARVGGDAGRGRRAAARCGPGGHPGGGRRRFRRQANTELLQHLRLTERTVILMFWIR